MAKSQRKAAKPTLNKGLNGHTHAESIGEMTLTVPPDRALAPDGDATGGPFAAPYSPSGARNGAGSTPRTKEQRPSPAGRNGAQAATNGVRVQGQAPAPQRKSATWPAIQQDTRGTPAQAAPGKCNVCGRGGKRGPSLPSVEAIEAEMARTYREQKIDKLPAHIANARINSLRSLAAVKQTRRGLELAAETAKLAAENDAADAAEDSGDA